MCLCIIIFPQYIISLESLRHGAENKAILLQQHYSLMAQTFSPVTSVKTIRSTHNDNNKDTKETERRDKTYNGEVMVHSSVDGQHQCSETAVQASACCQSLDCHMNGRGSAFRSKRYTRHKSESVSSDNVMVFNDDDFGETDDSANYCSLSINTEQEVHVSQRTSLTSIETFSSLLQQHGSGTSYDDEADTNDGGIAFDGSGAGSGYRSAQNNDKSIGDVRQFSVTCQII